jgi:hypothetical protein
LKALGEVKDIYFRNSTQNRLIKRNLTQGIIGFILRRVVEIAEINNTGEFFYLFQDLLLIAPS